MLSNMLCKVFIFIFASSRIVTSLAQNTSAQYSPERHDTCIVPAHPPNGIYEVVEYPGARPGQSFDSLVLKVRCRRGFGVLQPDTQVFCLNGRWFERLPRCVRYCKLEPHPSVRFTCRGRNGFIECGEYVAPGTSVRPTCNSPIYYSPDSLSNMNCVHGSWDHVARCRAECGRITPESWALVIDGRPAKRGELPWHVGVYRKTSTPYSLICGGSLISNNVVLSAAHCFWSDVKKQLPASDFAVAIGKLYRSWDSELDSDAQMSNIKAIKIPKLFQGEQANYQQDIAVVILESPFTYKPHIRPVCLHFDRQFNKLQLQHGKLGKVAGWGLTTAKGNSSDILQVAEMPYINEDVCIETLPASFREYITGDKFCAGYTNGTALCHGDSGGGLAFPAKDLGVDRFYLRGIVSASPRSDDECTDDAYTAFTRVQDHEDFIKESIQASLKKICPHYLFQCADGSCADQGAECNGFPDCADGSDESIELCQPPTNTTNMPTPNGKCILPSYPQHGTYVVANTVNASPGQKYNSWLLTVSCDRGFGVENTDGETKENLAQVNCTDGDWDRAMPKCGQPKKPGKFIVWFRNETYLLLLWQPPYPAGLYTHYKLSIIPPDGPNSVQYVKRDMELAGPAQAIFKGLVPGRQYSISVQTVLGSEISTPVIAQYRTVPYRPSNLTVIEANETSFRVKWLPPQDKSDFDGYQVTLSGSDDGGRKEPIRLDADDTMEASFHDLKPGASYTITVKSVSGKLTSWPSITDVTMRPLPVTGLSCRYEYYGKLILTWSPTNNSTQDEYKVMYYEAPANSSATIDTLKTPEPSIVIKDQELGPESNYTVTVLAVSRDVNSRETSTECTRNFDLSDLTTTVTSKLL